MAARLKCFLSLLAASVVLILGQASHAASITWSQPATITSDSDVLTNGTLVYAYDLSNTATTVNGVAFTAGASASAISSNISISGLQKTYSGFGASAAPFSNLSASYQNAIKGGAWQDSSVATVTLLNLTTGQTYAVQVWVQDARGGFTATRTAVVTSTSGNSVTLSYYAGGTSSSPSGGVGQYSIGTFTADATSQAFTITGNSSSQLNAIQVRNTAATSSVATLSSLVLSSATLSPAFASSTLAYTTSVSNATASLTVTPTVTDATATLKVNGIAVASGSASSAIPLAVGSNTITAAVTAQDGVTTTTYTVTVTRLAALPTVTTPTSASITSTSATLGGDITSNGGAIVSALGVVFAPTATNNNPQIGGTGVTNVTGTGTSGVFTVNVGGLSPGTSYSFAAYATNSQGTSYSVTANFTTPATIPTVTTPTYASLTGTTATLGGNVTGNGGASVTALGVVFAPTATNPNPQLGGVGVTNVTGTGATGVFTVNVSGLSPGTAYTFAAYATNSQGTGYSVTSSFSTLSSNDNLSNLVLSSGTLAPTFASGTLAYTASVSNATSSITVTPTAAQTNATIKVNGTSVVSGSASTPISLAIGSNTISTVVTAQDGITTHTYTVAVTRLAALPTVTTPTSTGITGTAATLGGNVSSNGGASLTSLGVVFAPTATNSNPQIGGTGVTNVTGTGTGGVFTVNISGLSPGTSYTFAAYATNSAGTGYSATGTFSTQATTTTVTTPTFASITATTATLGGNVTANGGATVTALGVVFAPTATNSNPQIGGTGVTNVTGTGTSGVFTVNVSGLMPSTAYTFAAYATNSQGTGYSSTSSFTTPATTPTITTPTYASITATTATLGGNVTTNGGATVSALGVVLAPTATNSNPQLGGTGVTNVTGTGTSGVFTVNVSSLSPGTSYTFAAYATNSAGTGYSIAGIFYTSTPFTYYTPTGYNAIITGYTGTPPAALNIPATLGGYPVTSIGQGAFEGRTGLTSVTIPTSVTTIGDYAFEECTRLASVTFANPSSLVSIGEEAFGYCSSLTSMTLPASVTSIGKEAYIGCGLTSVTIPTSVTTIGDYAFYGCGLTSVNIPSSVTSIGDSAFSNCGNLLSVTIPASVTSIGNMAFLGCTSLTSITIPNSVTSIGGAVFEGCTNLTSVTIPASVTSIGDYAFCGCTSLTGVTLPASVISIGVEAFYQCTGLTGVTIPASVTSIGDEAFMYCSKLASVIFATPSSLISIGNCAFSNCTSLTSMTIPASVTSIGNHMLSDCSKLTSVTISASVTSIGVGAFDGCTSLTSVAIPSTVTSIGEGAFGGCTSLSSIIIPASVTSIGEEAFSDCSNLASVTFATPSSLANIGNMAFYQCPNLISMTIPNGVTSIGDDAFIFCSNLASVTFATPSSLTSIGNAAFDGCTNLTSVTIPSSVTSIGDDAFFHCCNLASVTFATPSSLASIGNAAFEDCSELLSVTIPGSVTSIGEDAFSDCSGLTGVAFVTPSSITSIGKDAFEGCTGLTGVTIPNGVTNIGVGAFSYCSNLTAITVATGNPDYSSVGGVLFDNNQVTLIQYPGGLTGSFSVPNSITSIEDYAFGGCTNLTSVTIPDSVTSIGNYAFDYCPALTEAIFLGSAPTMETDVFNYVAIGFTVYYATGATGFTEPSWHGYQSSTICPPTVTKPTSASITATTAKLGGNVTSNGGAVVTALGVVYAPTATNPNPQLGGVGVTNVTGTGATGVFTLNISGLSPGTAYTFAAYAINSQGTGYSASGSFTTLSNNDNLANLVLSVGTLTPAFASSTLGYTASVGYATTSLTVTPTAAQANATMKVNGITVASGSASVPVSLAVGANPITILVTAQDGVTAQTYTVAVSRLAPPTVTTPTYASVTGTTVMLGGNVTSNGGAAVTAFGVVYAPTATNSNPQIGGMGVTNVTGTGTGGVFTVNAGSLSPGTAYKFAAYATNSQGTGYSAMGSFTTLSNNDNLANLVLSVGTLTPAFASSTLGYTASVGYATTSLTVTPTAAQTNATIKVNGTSVVSGSATGPVSLAVGANPITILVTAQDGVTAQTYTVAVTRLVDPPTVTTPTFAGVTGTTVTLGGNVTSNGGATVTALGLVYAPTAINNNPQIGGTGVTGTGTIGVFTVNVSGLSPGTAYTFAAYATNSAGTSYSSTGTFTTLSNNDNLSNLVLSSGTLAPTFASGTSGYAASVSNATTSLTVTPTAAQANATMKVNGITVVSGSASVPVSLAVGANPITILVTAQDGVTAQTYTVTVTRLAPPTVTAPTYASLTSSSATLGGNVTANSGATVTALGVVFSPSAANANPQIGGIDVTNVAGAGTSGVFTVNVSGLSPGTAYSFAAYATNSQGTGYSATGSFTTSPSFAFAYTTSGRAVTITGYTGLPPATMILPATLNGLSVTAIGANAFSNCTGLTCIVIPASVTSIESGAFIGCSSLKTAFFMGSYNASSMGSTLFNSAASGFTGYYFDGASGFTANPSGGVFPYTSIDMGAYSPAVPWLISMGYAYNESLSSPVPKLGGTSLLMAYALNLDPNQSQASSLPKQVVTGGQMGLTYYAGNTDVSYQVESSADLKTWSSLGVTVSAPDGHCNCTATVPITSGSRFLRLVVTH